MSAVDYPAQYMYATLKVEYSGFVIRFASLSTSRS